MMVFTHRSRTWRSSARTGSTGLRPCSRRTGSAFSPSDASAPCVPRPSRSKPVRLGAGSDVSTSRSILTFTCGGVRGDAGVRQFLAKRELLRRKRLRAALLAQKVCFLAPPPARPLSACTSVDALATLSSDLPDAAGQEGVQKDALCCAHLPARYRRLGRSPPTHSCDHSLTRVCASWRRCVQCSAG
jgi:hypothetical protein